MKTLISKMIIIIVLSNLSSAQVKNIINYSFQESSYAVSKQADIRINMYIGKTVVGVSSSDKVILKGNNFFLNQKDNVVLPDKDKELPSVYSLGQNYPNPFNPVTRIKFSIPKEGYVSLSIYNMLGEKVYQLVDETRSPGIYTIDWDAKGFTSGIYLYTIKCGSYTESKKLILLK